MCSREGMGTMVLGELIYKRLASSEGLAKKLATFNGFPAVFSPDPG